MSLPTHVCSLLVKGAADKKKNALAHEIKCVTADIYVLMVTLDA